MNPMPKNLDTVVLPVAGVGSRMLPITSAIEKCMLPVAGRPVIDYTVVDCQKAGITRVIFVCSKRGEQQLRDYFEALNPDVEAQLVALGKQNLVDDERERRESYGMTFEYIIQEPGQSYGYGSVVPLWLAKDSLKGTQAFAYMMGDDIVFHADDTSETKLALQAWQSSGADHLIMGTSVTRIQARRYGLLASDASHRLTSIIEKPDEAQIPEAPVANVARYMFDSSIWPYVDREMQQTRTAPAEHMITDHVIQPALEAGQHFLVHTTEGTYLDAGSPDGFLATQAHISEHLAS